MSQSGKEQASGHIMKLNDKVAVITGAGRGIGKAIALTFAREGASIIAISRTEQEIRETAREAESLGRRSMALRCDVSIRDDVEGMVERVIREMGKIDILVNNAGVQHAIGPMVENDPAVWIEEININLIGTFLCTRVVLPHMIRRHYGKIITVSGGGATSPRPYFSAYACSKAAVVRLTETLSEEVKPYNIQVNGISPGSMVMTRMIEEVIAAGSAAGDATRARAIRTKEEGTSPQPTAELALFLASDESDGISGRIINARLDDWKAIAK